MRILVLGGNGSVVGLTSDEKKEVLAAWHAHQP